LKLASGKISFDGSTLTINGSGTFSGSITATSGSIATALTIGPTAKIGIGVSGSNNGLLLNSTNYWYDSGTFNVGSSTSFINWNGSALLINGGKLQVGTVAIGKDVNGTGIHGIKFQSGDYWTTDGKLSLANGNITYNGSGSTLTINGSGTFSGSITATSGSIATALAIGPTAKIGTGVSGSNNGLLLNSTNYWYDSGTFNVGSSTSFINWNGSNLTISNGTINIDSTIKLGYNANGTGNHGIVLNGNNYWYYNSSI